MGFDFPNLPYLIDGDLKLSESEAIFRYISNKYNPELLGKNTEDKAKVDMLYSFSTDIRKASYNIAYETGDRNAIQALAFERFAPISKFLGDKDFIVGSYVTFPDFYISEQIEMFDFFCNQGGLTKRLPNLATYRDRMTALSGVKEYRESDRFLKRPFNGKRAKINNCRRVSLLL